MREYSTRRILFLGTGSTGSTDPYSIVHQLRSSCLLNAPRFDLVAKVSSDCLLTPVLAQSGEEFLEVGGPGDGSQEPQRPPEPAGDPLAERGGLKVGVDHVEVDLAFLGDPAEGLEDAHLLGAEAEDEGLQVEVVVGELLGAVAARGGVLQTRKSLLKRFGLSMNVKLERQKATRLFKQFSNLSSTYGRIQDSGTLLLRSLDSARQGLPKTSFHWKIWTKYALN